jgi:hypothetical protein
MGEREREEGGAMCESKRCLMDIVIPDIYMCLA